jgi:hypothetical protein
MRYTESAALSKVIVIPKLLKKHGLWRYRRSGQHIPISLYASVAVSSGISRKSAEGVRTYLISLAMEISPWGLRKLVVYRAWALNVRAFMGSPISKG